MALNKKRYHTAQLMNLVILALIPGIIAQVVAYGGIIISHLALASLTALLTEHLVLTYQQQRRQALWLDGSAVLTAFLLTLSLPVYCSWWLVVIATVTALLLGKHVYGGLGQNIFNPAMVGYVVVLVSFPAEMTQWASPFDAISSATPLDSASSAQKMQQTVSLPMTHFIWLAAAWLFGGLFLLIKKIIQWRLSLGFLLGLIVFNLSHSVLSGGQSLPLLVELFSNSTLFAAFFIVTDPVTAATTPKGQWLFALGLAALTVLIRHSGSYADGIAFAVLLMNACVPLLDAITIPKLRGEKKS